MKVRNRSDPTGAANEMALARTRDLAVVVQQVQYAQQALRMEQRGNGLPEIETPLLQWSERKRGRVQVAGWTRVQPERAEQGRAAAGIGRGDDTDNQRQRGTKSGERTSKGSRRNRFLGLRRRNGCARL